MDSPAIQTPEVVSTPFGLIPKEKQTKPKKGKEPKEPKEPKEKAPRKPTITKPMKEMIEAVNDLCAEKEMYADEEILLERKKNTKQSAEQILQELRNKHGVIVAHDLFAQAAEREAVAAAKAAAAAAASEASEAPEIRVQPGTAETVEIDDNNDFSEDENDEEHDEEHDDHDFPFSEAENVRTSTDKTAAPADKTDKTADKTDKKPKKPRVSHTAKYTMTATSMVCVAKILSHIATHYTKEQPKIFNNLVFASNAKEGGVKCAFRSSLKNMDELRAILEEVDDRMTQKTVLTLAQID
jgi:hypothetical protein